ncbi:MAG: hypothetical protein GX776_06020 [Oxalobacter sp.]|nr:hypothetical protein [Oxalobacter sp.]
MRIIKYAFATVLGLLFLVACYGIAQKNDDRWEANIKEHAARTARHYWLKDAGREHEEMRQLAMDVQFAELSERAKKLKGKK